jgi:pimeloyl-ACP methyl ester carboxylesterase
VDSNAGPGQPGQQPTVNFNLGGQVRGSNLFGVVYGDVRVYSDDASAPPEQRFTTALNLLDGNLARRAEKLIGQVVERGYRNNMVLYYWALAVLSGRSFDHLSQDEFATLRSCSTMSDSGARDGWLAALHVIMMFINCLIRQEGYFVEDEEFDRVIAAYDSLEESRREEIRRHLDLIMTGALQDRLDSKYAAEASRLRMEGNRAGRAWKFFEADPEPPRARTLDEPKASVATQIAAGFAAALTGGALLALLIGGIAHDPLLALIFAGGTGAGGYLLATTGRRHKVARERIAADDVRHGAQPVPSRYGPVPELPAAARRDDFVPGVSDRADREHATKVLREKLFRSVVPARIEARFNSQNPDGENGRRDWRASTGGLRAVLAADILDRYASPDMPVNRLDWLITWHARRAKEQWENRQLRGHRDRLRAAAPNGGLLFLGVIGVAGGLICGAIAAFDWNVLDSLALLAIAAFGGWIGYLSKFDVHVVRHDIYLAESALAAELHGQEMAEFHRWQGVLRDRPTDAEMARWLDYDKIHAKNLVMRDRNMANRDIVAHAALTEALHPCQRARVLFGPPRYSQYQVTVILLTGAGVRHLSMGLNFVTGGFTSTNSQVFRYDSISSAQLVNVGVRFDAGRRKVVPVDEAGGAGVLGVPGTGAPAGPWHDNSQAMGNSWEDQQRRTANQGTALSRQPADDLIFGQALRITLVATENIDVVVENIDDGFLDRVHENAESLLELALDNSGVRGAQQVLEHVAAEGRDWLAEERRRRNRRMLDFGQSVGRAQELNGNTGPTPAGLSRPQARALPYGEAERVVVPAVPNGSWHHDPGPRVVSRAEAPVPIRGTVTDAGSLAHVAVLGGVLEVEAFTGGTEPVLAVHGISSQRRQWSWLRAARPDITLITPDLRGRGGSAAVRGPSSIAHHAADLVAVLDHLGLGAAHVCGMSMGASVAVELAAAYPGRVKSLILVDGGFPTGLPAGLTPEATADAISDRLAQISWAWPSGRDYAQFYTGRMAPLLDPEDPLLAGYFAHELAGNRIRLNGEMLSADAAQAASTPSSRWQQLRVPVRLLAAEWGTGRASSPAYSAATVAAIRRELPASVTVVPLQGADHMACVMTTAGALAVAALIEEALVAAR